jgi:pyrimidine-specific ribonucleoside hydrolase
MAPDDWMAILYLLARPDVSVDAITVVGTGESHCAPGVEHAAGLTMLAGQPDIPIACGSEKPLAGDHAFPDAWRADVDNLIGLSLPQGSAPATSATAPELLDQTVMRSANPVTILTLGPMTNVAQALNSDSGLTRAIAGIYSMGGAIVVDGNVGASLGIDNQHAEWNIYCDPTAAQMVLGSGVPVTLVPLDATNNVPITPDFVNAFSSNAATDSARFVLEVLDERMHDIQSGTYFFWDPFAAAVMTDESLTSFKNAQLTVETAEGSDSGRIVSATSGQVRYGDSGNKTQFEQEFSTTLNSAHN